MVAVHGSVVKSPLHSRSAFHSRVVGNAEVTRFTRHAARRFFRFSLAASNFRSRSA
jgi:hypothetical protein